MCSRVSDRPVDFQTMARQGNIHSASREKSDAKSVGSAAITLCSQTDSKRPTGLFLGAAT